MSCAVGLHHAAVAKDETKHDFVWQPVSGTALIHGNPAVSRELEGRAAIGKRGGAEREKQRQEKIKEMNRKLRLPGCTYTL